MKKKRISIFRTLLLDREIIAKLDDDQLSTIAGGQQPDDQTTQTGGSSCPVFSCNPDNCRGLPTQQ